MIIQLYRSYTRIFSLQKVISKFPSTNPFQTMWRRCSRCRKKNIKEANLKWGVGAVLFSERCLGHLTRFFKNFVANLSYQITYKIKLIFLSFTFMSSGLPDTDSWGQASTGSRRKVCYHRVWTVFWCCGLHSSRAGYFRPKKSGIKNLSWLCYSCTMQYFWLNI